MAYVMRMLYGHVTLVAILTLLVIQNWSLRYPEALMISPWCLVRSTCTLVCVFMLSIIHSIVYNLTIYIHPYINTLMLISLYINHAYKLIYPVHVYTPSSVYSCMYNVYPLINILILIPLYVNFHFICTCILIIYSDMYILHTPSYTCMCI